MLLYTEAGWIVKARRSCAVCLADIAVGIASFVV
jgi:hypothetical protein